MNRREALMFAGAGAVSALGAGPVAAAASVAAEPRKSVKEAANALIEALQAEMPAEADRLAVVVNVDRQTRQDALWICGYRRRFVEDKRIPTGGFFAESRLDDRIVYL